MKRLVTLVSILVIIPLLSYSRSLRIATGSPYELGLVDALYKAFSKKYPCELEVTKAGSGKSLKLLKEGKVDVIMVHYPEGELKAVEEGWATYRKYIGSNDFVIVGPESDPAGIKSCKTVFCAYKRIADAKATFISRGDNSGTHKKEMFIWKSLGIKPKGNWYVTTKDFMMASLLKANELKGYFMTDRSTYIVARKKHPELKLKILFEGDPWLINRYHALVGKHSPNFNLAKAFVDFLVGKEGQKIIGEFGKREYGKPLYWNASHKFGEIIIFHAGSLSVPFSKMEKLYESLNEGIDVKRESCGSRRCARMITDLGKPCDIMASADVEVIKTMLYPEFTSWYAVFATNSMVLAYTERSRYAKEINRNNWFEILARDDVSFGYSDPELDPCGYRTILLMKLAGIYYKKPDIEKLAGKGVIRPKSVELLGLLETGNLDYAFEYKSVAVQHGLKYIDFPKEINLSDPSLDSYYKKVFVELSGKKKGERIKVYGKSIAYALTSIKNAPNKSFALHFISFVLNKNYGLKILDKCGQKPIYPPRIYGKTPLCLEYYLPYFFKVVTR